MRNGIYLDKKTNKWYISTKINNKQCTIRGFNSKKEANEKYDYEIANWKRQHSFFESGLTYENLKNEFLYYRGLEISQESLRKDKTQFSSFWDNIFVGNVATTIFDIKRLEIIYKNLVSDETLNNRKKQAITKTFKDFAFFCYQHRYITTEIYQSIDITFRPFKISRIVSKEKRVIPQNEIKAFLGAININHKDLPMFTLFVCLGARISEFLGILVNCYDRENRKIEIKRQLLTNGKLTDQLKTSNSYRKVLISKETANLLNEYIDNNSLKDDDRLFKISHIEFKRRLRKYEDMAGIPHYSSHEYRHTRATNMASKCETMSDVITCAKMLGHSTSMFLNTYCHSMNENEEKFL